MPVCDLVAVGCSGGDGRSAAEGATQEGLQAVHVDVDDRGGEQCEHLAENQATDDGDAERPANLRAYARAKG